VQSIIPDPNDEDEELQEMLEVLRHEAKAGQHYEHGGGSGGGGGGGGVKGFVEEPRPRGKGLEILMPQEPRHQFKLR
jgi:hypothetical protein